MEKLGLDLDGVLYPFIPAVETYCRVNHGFSGSSDDFSRNSKKYFEQYKLDWLIESPDLYYKFIPSSNLMSLLNRLSKKYILYYMTARPLSVLRITESYLREHKFPQNYNLLFCKDKATYARLLQVNYFVEDNPENAESLSKTCLSFLMNQPYNEKAEGNFTRISTLFDLETILL